MDTKADEIVTLDQGDLPALFQSADESSLKGQRRFLRATQLRLAMLIVAGGSGAVAVADETLEWLGFVAATTFAVALIVEVVIMTSRPERVWYEGRSAAESVKTLAWRYAVGGDPFSLGQQDNRQTDQLFIVRLRDILRDLRNLDLSPKLEGQEQITRPMRELRARTIGERKAAYSVGRVEDQRVWYATRSSRDEARARWWMSAMMTMEVSGVALGLLRAVGAFRIDLLGFASTIAVAIAAWMQAKQHQMQARAYFLAAQELASIRSEVELQDTEEEWAAFIDEAEEAISREHTLWRASRGA